MMKNECNAYINIIIKIQSIIKKFCVPLDNRKTLLECICYIQENLDPSTIIRWNCRSGQCGICAVLVNGVPKLACQEMIIPNHEYVVEPIFGDAQIHSLVCDVSDFYKMYFLASHFYCENEELKNKEDFESLLLDIKHKIIPNISLNDSKALYESLLQITNYSWFEKCFQGNTPRQLPSKCPQRNILIKSKLVDFFGRVNYRVNILRNCIFITDGPWNIHNGGIFPYSDESDLILKYIETHAIDKISQGIVDIGCGCGHVSIAYFGKGPRFAFDKNPRAGYFLAFNSIINHCEIKYRTINISNGLPTDIAKMIKKNTLFVVNMPHALSPSPDILPKTSDGGRTGLKLTISALKALYPFCGSDSIAVVLCYSLGNLEQNKWDISIQAQKIFQKDTLKWELLKGSRIWRINGKKEQPNPMLLRDCLPKKADCKLYVKDKNREEVRHSYIKLVDFFENEDWNVLGCGILRIKL